MSLRQNAFVMVVLTVLLAILGIWGSDAAFDQAWLLPLALLLLGLAYEGWVVQRASTRLEVMEAPRGILGRPFELLVSLRHRLHRAAFIELAPEAPEAIEIEGAMREVNVAPGEGATVRVRAVARRLGQHAWPAWRARVAGPLGLAWWSRRLSADLATQVVPDLLRGGEAAAGASSLGSHMRAAMGSGAEVLQLRDYRPGDPQSVIDWKASARSAHLISRDFSEDQHLEIVLAVDAGRSSALRAGDLDRFGHYVNVAARFAEHAVARDDRVGLVLFADRPLTALAPGRGISTVLRLRDILTASKLVAAESNPLNAALRVRTLVRHRALVVFLTDLDDATIAGQLASAAKLLMPKHLPFFAGMLSVEALQLGAAPARKWLDPYEALAAQEYVARLERNTRALRALGAPALLARPEQLESAVFGAYAEFKRRRRV
jgi:uncharacterized protein (DUF58 family)